MNLAAGYSFKIEEIACSTGKVSFLQAALPLLNRIVLALAFNCLMCSSVTSGHPLLATVPLTSGHLSSLSRTPSPSVSGHGHPPFSARPATVGHLSEPSVTPSPSVSGHPFIDFRPATSGH